VTVTENLIETAAVEIAGSRQSRLRSHGKTPATGGSVPKLGHSTMLCEDEKSFNLNQLWVVQGWLTNIIAGEVFAPTSFQTIG
jgi:hypothetical protein